MSGPGPASVVRALIEAVVGLDAETATSLCTPDLRLRVEGFDEFEGHDGLRGLMEFQGELMGVVDVEFRHVLVDGDVVAVERTEWFELGGERISLHVGAILRLRGGLVAEWTDFQDLREVDHALGY